LYIEIFRYARPSWRAKRDNNKACLRTAMFASILCPEVATFLINQAVLNHIVHGKPLALGKRYVSDAAFLGFGQVLLGGRPAGRTHLPGEPPVDLLPTVDQINEGGRVSWIPKQG
jgi:hypothetical protein